MLEVQFLDLGNYEIMFLLVFSRRSFQTFYFK